MYLTVDPFPDEAVAAAVTMIALEKEMRAQDSFFGWPRLDLLSPERSTGRRNGKERREQRVFRRGV